MLRRIRIQNYKSLRDVDVALNPLSVIFGPNAAGKSNFLDALQLLSRLATSRTLKEAFEPPYRGNPLESFSFGPKGIRSLLNQESATFSIEADIELSPHVITTVEREIREFRRTTGEHPSDSPESTVTIRESIRERFLRYRVEIEIFPRSGMLRVVDERLSALRQDGQLKESRRPFLEKVRGKLHLRMEKQSHPMQFDPQLDHTILSRPLYAPHYPHLLATKYELASWLFFYFEPRERMRSPNSVREVTHLGLMGEELAAFLNTMKATRPLQFRAIEKALTSIVTTASALDVDVNELGQVEFRVIEGGTPVSARLLSEGTLRVLGLLAAGSAPEAPGLVGLEEPENGVHPRRIELIAEYLKTRSRSGKSQLVVTTHSPILLDLIPTESLLVARKEKGATLITPLEAWGELARSVFITDGLEEPPLRRLSERVVGGEFGG